MNNLILLAVCFLAGMLLRRSGRMPLSAPAVLNSFIINVSLPALTLLSIHGMQLTSGALLPASMPWLHFALAAAFFLMVGRVMKLPRATVGALILTGGMGNTSFLGLPMIEAFYGKAGLGYGIMVDQFGSFMVLSTLGITVAGFYSDGAPSAGAILKRIVLFPPFISLLAALLLIGVDYPSWLTAVLQRLGDTLAPLALLSVGFAFQPGHLAGNGSRLALGLGFKLILAPLILALFYVYGLGAHGFSAQIMLFEAAMPPMITAGIIASEHDIDPPLAGLMVAFGVVFSFVTLPLWRLVLGGL
ncbi:AEC family transporter [Chlorobium phaeovibrioides]|uniref:AEC family transporter n=2 Tax=Chlorobium phaeovibrioides TaxID=1094 RepID=A0A432AWU1_CHLPH|nr:AEC family transporter [Chlorobium phaeovibrioides]HCD36012.1 transporter [Chlorobium sp.]KAA6233090.1 AEC family transporter [Chlorobium phaeovibrioides]MWV53680.1 AEC family transporter [Chlorobium phaeovibrioides]RTY35804.1 AEC family transporter [Chlorobium phaeovibrioides]RTY39116.1 AEC family transporter [Chlorobium phaeovibrioides]